MDRCGQVCPQTGALFLADFKSVKFKRLLHLTKVFFRRGVFLSSDSVLAAKGAPSPQDRISPDTPGLLDHGSRALQSYRARDHGRSVRHPSVLLDERVLQRWLSGRERSLLTDYGCGTRPDHGDPFLEILLVAYSGDLDGPQDTRHSPCMQWTRRPWTGTV